MPTMRPRHSITETPPVQAALDELRAAMPGVRIPLGELVVLGAQRKIEQIRATSERTTALLDDLARRVSEGDLGVDPAAAAEVRRTGWVRP